jgi:preprotein translocase subunit SecF
VSFTDVGPTWGSQITDKAILAVLVFFVVVVLYITLRFEWKMAIAALIAVVHDLLVTAGVYSILGFQVTPDTVVAVLTILGYSLYDTVVVFDRVGENTKGFGASGRMTYEDVVNLSMNQTLARSMNTSLVAILPVLSVLIVGAQILGATTLQYFGLALVIGLTSGAYSSIFIASPILAGMKEREPRYINIRQKLANRADRVGLLTPRAAALSMATATGGSARAATRAAARAAPAAKRSGEVLRPGSAPRAAAPVTEAEVVADEELVTPNGAPRRAGTAAKRPAASGGGRPAPRPRKGKGKGKGGKRR